MPKLTWILFIIVKVTEHCTVISEDAVARGYV